MTESFGAGNAIGWAQFKLRGGWKTVGATTAGYAVLVGGGMILSTRLASGRVSAAFAGWAAALLAIQAAGLILFAGSRVGTAIRQDLSGRMIESHRLMPTSPASAVAGYVFGASSQVVALAVTNLLLGLLAVSAAGTSPARWLTANAVLLSFAMFIWVVIAFGAFVGRGVAMLVWILLSVVAMGGGGPSSLLPGLGVLVTPLSGASVFSLGVAGADAVSLYATSTAAHVWVGAVCYAGACRRYRSDDAAALGPLLGLLLLLAWVTISTLGIVKWDDYRPRYTGPPIVEPRVQFLASTAVAMLLGVAPLAVSARADGEWRRRRRAADPAVGRRPLPPLVTAFFAAGITLLCTFSIASAYREPLPLVARTAVVLGAFFLSTLYLLRILSRATASVSVLVLVWALLTSVAPLLIDFAQYSMTGRPAFAPRAVVSDDEMLGPVSACGPLGALIHIWTNRSEITTAGITFQLLLAAGMAALFYLTARPKQAPPGFPVVKA